jgi:hypothetical protein
MKPADASMSRVKFEPKSKMARPFYMAEPVL